MKKIVLLLMISLLTAFFTVSCGEKNSASNNSITVMVPDWAVPSDEMLDAFTKDTGLIYKIFSFDSEKDKAEEIIRNSK